MAINELTLSATRSFRDDIRHAREDLLENAENFGPLVQVIESLGRYVHVNPEHHGLNRFESSLLLFVRKAFNYDDENAEQFKRAFRRLFESVRHARNDLMHTGAYARNVADRAGELAIILEDALNRGLTTAGDLMVSSPVCAERWHTLAMVRKTMLLHSYSYLPIQFGADDWRLVTDFEVARYLRSGSRYVRLQQRMEELMAGQIPHVEPAHTSDPLAQLSDYDRFQFLPAIQVAADTEVPELLKLMHREPALVVDGENLVGFITPFDLL